MDNGFIFLCGPVSTWQLDMQPSKIIWYIKKATWSSDTSSMINFCYLAK